MNGFEKRTTQKKAIIKSSALSLLKTSDPSKMRVADIAEAAGVSQVTIYNYFGSKEGLFREVYMDTMQHALQEFEEFVAGNHSLKEKVAYIVFQKKATSRTFGVSTIKHMLQDDPEMAVFIKEYMAKSYPLLIQLIEDGKSKGEISSALSTSTIMFYMQMWTSQVDNVLEYAKQQDDMDTFIEEMVHLFFFGFGIAPN